jgi:beta-glucanase (GH16 family)
VDSTWQRAYTLTNGQAALDLGTQPLGDHQITARYRESSTSATSQMTVTWTAPGTIQTPTTTALMLNADGTGTITVTSTGTTPTNPVDLWIDSTWQRAYTLTNGQAALDLGEQPGGDHQITARYRESSTSAASQASVPWSVVTAAQSPTTTTLSVMPDGTVTVTVTVEDGQTAGNPVDLWVQGRARSTYTLKDGRVRIALGIRAGGDLPVKVRYRPSATQLESAATAVWSVDTAPKPRPGACGPTVTKANGSAWRCTFADNFDGSTLDRSKWKVQTDFVSGDDAHQACYVDSPQNLAVAGGALRLTVRKGAPQQCAALGGAVTSYTSGMVTTWHTWSQQYGRFEARVKTTATTSPGLHEAFWLWPDDRYPEGQGTWPANGEIDVAETYSKLPNLVVPYLHTALDTPNGTLTGINTNTNWRCIGRRGVFNTYTLEWTPARVVIFVNGQRCVVNTSGNDAFKKRYIMALTQGLDSHAGNGVVDSTPIPATMAVDYVRAWS